LVVQTAERIGLHDPNSERMEDHFSPHCCRHWFTTHLRRAGMPREFIQELRGDVRREAIDIYDHIDKKELRESYLAHIPQLGI
jgi:integrase/recombinase XerD